MRSSLFTVILSFCASLTLALPASTVDAAEEQVLTPGGLRPKSQVHYVPPGGLVRHTEDAILLIDKDGNTLHTAPHVSEVKRSSLEARFSGWATYAYWTDNTGSPISSFSTTWTVPSVPVTNVGQTIFLFNSIEPLSGSAILQPVLQFGPSAAGGGSYWAAASWYVGSSTTYYSSVVKVSVGQSLTGLITLTSQSGSSYNYASSFTNVGGTSITLQNSDQLVWATETLEVYGTQKSTDYPHGSTPMASINLKTVASSSPSVSWSVKSDTTDGLTATVVTNGAVNGRVDIHYPA